MPEETTQTGATGTGTQGGGTGGAGGGTGTTGGGSSTQSQTKPPAGSGSKSSKETTAGQQTVIQMTPEVLSEGIAAAISKATGTAPPPSSTEAKPKNLDEAPPGGAYIVGDEVKNSDGKKIGHVTKGGKVVLDKEED